MKKDGQLVLWVAVVYTVLAVTFSMLLSQSLDHHFDFAVQERINFGGAVFTASRVFSPLIVEVFAKTGLPVRTAAMIYTAIATATLLYFFAVLLEKWGRLGREQSFFLAPFILLPMVWNYIILSSIYCLFLGWVKTLAFRRSLQEAAVLC